LLLVFLTLVVGCSRESEKNYTIEIINGVKVYKNMDKPSARDLAISHKEIFRLDGTDDRYEGTDREFVWPRFLDIDSKGNIFVVDRASASVKKFDKNGNFIKSFGGKGTGPGEMQFPFMLAVLNDTVYVADPAGSRIVKFDADGNFIENITLTQGMPKYMQPVGNNRFICFIHSYRQNPNGLVMYHNLTLTDQQFRVTATLSEYQLEFNPADRWGDFLDRYTPYAVGKDTIFVADNTHEHYKINAFDFSGQLLYSIKKEYRKIPFEKVELDELNRTLGATLKKFRTSNYKPIQVDFKKAINSMYCDKEGRLWVAASVKRNQDNRYDFLVDIFKDGVFLKKIKLQIAKGYDFMKIHDEKIFFKGSRIYHIDETTAVVKVFQY
jgi:hypothetical protein